jgi:hypothetical protein
VGFLGIRDQHHLACIPAALQQLVSTGSLATRDTIGNDRVQLAADLVVEWTPAGVIPAGAVRSPIAS